MKEQAALLELGFSKTGLKKLDDEHTLRYDQRDGFDVIISKPGQAEITVRPEMIIDNEVKLQMMEIFESFKDLVDDPKKNLEDSGFENVQETEKPKEVWKKPERKTVEKKTAMIPLSMQDRQVQDLNISDIKQYICDKATDQEAFMFLKLCQARGLNPFTKEAYLIKYKQNQPATTVVGKDAFMRRAEANPQYNGFEAGIILRNETGDIERREGTFIMKSETLLGGWAKVYRKDRDHPFVSEVSFDEYAGMKAEYVNGQPTNNKVLNSMWEAHGPTMIRKVPIVQSHREAFPGELGGLYDSVEINQEEDY